jgi:FixJ family two-component response regulator
MDINLQGKQTGMDLLKESRDLNSEIPVVIITGSPDVPTAIEAVRNSAFDYLCKPIEKEQLLRIAAAAVKLKKTSDEKERYQRNLEAVFRSVRDTVVTMDLNMSMKHLDTGANVLLGERRHPRPQHLHHPESSPQGALEIELSGREQQILRMLGHGESNAEIAEALFISIRTVETYFARISAKLKLEGMKGLRRYAIKNNLR